MARQQYADAFAGTVDFGGMVGDPGTTTTADAPLGHMPSHGEANGDGMGLMDGLVGRTAFGDVDMEMDLSGAQLWDWFNKNQSIMRMLEDT